MTMLSMGRGIIQEGLYPLFEIRENGNMYHDGQHLAVFDFRGLKRKSNSLDSMRAIVRTLPVHERNTLGGNYLLRLEGDKLPRIHYLLDIPSGDSETEEKKICEFLRSNEKIYTDPPNNPPEINSQKGFRNGRYANLFTKSFIGFDDFKSHCEADEFPDEIFHDKKDIDRYDPEKQFRKWKISADSVYVLEDLMALALEFRKGGGK